MKNLRALLLVITTAATLAGCSSLDYLQSKPKITIRFHAEASASSGASFIEPIKFHYPERSGYIERMATVGDRDFVAVYPFEAKDGSWGCYFKLDPHGRIAINTLASQRPGTSIVAIVSTKQGQHQVVDMIVDHPTRDGMIAIPQGLTLGEVQFIRERWPVIGDAKDTKRRKSMPWLGLDGQGAASENVRD